MKPKTIKLTPEEKAENKLIKKQWNEFIRRMVKKGAIVTAIFVLFSCSTVKRYSYEAVNLQEGEISKYHVKANLISADRTMKGFKHVFVTEKGDTLAPRFYAKPMEVNKCYWVWKTKLEKNL